MTPSVPLTIDPAHRDALASVGLSEFEDFWKFDRGAVVKALVPGRSTARFEAAGKIYFLKRGEGAAAAEMSNEARVLGVLHGAGLPVPQPIAVGLSEVHGILVTSGLPARANLEDVLCKSSPPLDPARSRRHLRRLVDLVRRLHAVGVQQRDCYLVHVLVGSDDELFLVDFGRARVVGRVGLFARVRDLAGLDFSTPARLAGPVLRLGLLGRYLGTRSRLWRRIVARLVRWKSERIRRHVERRITRGDPNFHLNA
jgi:hypothetical protein